MDFTLTKEEERQKEAYIDFLRKDKGMAEITVMSYSNILQKKFSSLVREFFDSSFRNIYSVTDLKVLLKMEDSIWKISEINDANDKIKGKLSASFRAYIEYIESTLTDEDLANIAFGQDEEDEDNFVKLEVEENNQYTSYLPIYSIRAACGVFSNEKEVEAEGWVDVSLSNIKAKENMFVVHAKGHSMEPHIYDNDLCVFKKYEGEDLENEIVLTQLVSHDIEYGGMYTIKKYHAEKKEDEKGSIYNSKIMLLSYNPSYQPIILTEDNKDDVKTVGVFVGIIKLKEIGKK
jgi:hypothetical protein